MIYISIGSNQGDRLRNLRQAVNCLKEYLINFQASIILETKAILPLDSPRSWDKPYLNMVVRGSSILPPDGLLQILQDIEIKMGRPINHKKWAPRIIDLDILLWHDKIINISNLTIPHPELFHRHFLLHLIALMDDQYIYTVSDDSHYCGKTFGEIAYHLTSSSCFITSLVLNPCLVGIVNVTPDSFSDGNLYLDAERAIYKSLQLIYDGASVIELGAQSTRPNNETLLNPVEEWQRLEPVLNGVKNLMQQQDCSYTIAIDSFSPKIIFKALKHYPISWINDVTGSLDNKILQYIAECGCKIVVMHSITIPPNNQDIIEFDEKPTDLICSWAERIVAKLTLCGFSQEQIILDPGIGFGKSTYQNLFLLNNIKQLQKLGYKILVGHSRKSFINSFINLDVRERDLETIAISNELYNLGIDYLRVHNVKDHQRFFVARQIVSRYKNDR